MFNLYWRRNDFATGFSLVLAAALGFGLIPGLARALYVEGMSPEGVLLARFTLPALCLAVFLPGAFRRPGKALIAMASGVFMAVGVMAYLKAIAVLPIALAVLIYFTYPLFTVVLDWLLFGNPLSRHGMLACLLIVIACAALLRSGEWTAAQASTLLLAFLAPLAYAVLILIYTRVLADMPPLQRLAAGIWGTFTVAMPWALWLAPTASLLPASTQGWLTLLGVALFTSLLPQWLFTLGASRAGPLCTAIAGSVELIVGLMIGWCLLAEAVQSMQLFAALLIVLAVALVLHSAGVGIQAQAL